ncbi:MAG: BMP family protein [Bacillota bacterium]
MKKIAAIILILAMLGFVLGCSSTDVGNTSTSPENTAAESADIPEQTAEPQGPEPVKVALLLNGTINDGSYCQFAFEAVRDGVAEFNYEYAYTENIVLADTYSIAANYIDNGYTLLIANGADFSDAFRILSAEFPDVKFGILSGNESAEPNLSDYRCYTPQVGFLAGSIAAMASKSGVVATAAGVAYAHVKDNVAGFEAGAKYINPDITVLTGYIESWSDVAKAKEMSMAYIEQGADVIYCSANAAALGAYEAAEESGNVLCIGATADMYETSPDTIIVSIIQSQYDIVYSVLKDFFAGTLDGTASVVGVAEGVVRLSDWHGHESWLPEGSLAKIDEILAGLSDLSLVKQGICPKSVYDTNVY